MRQNAPYFGSPVLIKSGKAHPPVHICGYVPVDTTQQTGQRTSRMVDLFLAETLIRRCLRRWLDNK